MTSRDQYQYQNVSNKSEKIVFFDSGIQFAIYVQNKYLVLRLLA